MRYLVSMSGRVVKRAFKYRFYPTDQQAAELPRTFGCVRLVYNKALEERTQAWYGEQRRISYVQSSAMLTAVEEDRGAGVPGRGVLGSAAAGAAASADAFANFFAKRAKYPRFKSGRSRGRRRSTPAAPSAGATGS